MAKHDYFNPAVTNKQLGFALLLFVGCYWACTNSISTPKQAAEADYLHFPSELVPTTPYDVDTKLQQELTSKGEFAAVDRLFDILAWQQFVAFNWPIGPDGKPTPKLSGSGLPIWEGWEESFELFQEDGGPPTAALDIPEHAEGKVDANSKVRILFRTNKSSHFHSRNKIDVADEIDQAFTSPIWDQNGNIVRYEIRLNKKMVDYVVGNQLYNYDGQIEFSKKGSIVNFPSGTRTEEGTIEIKVAWRILTDEDPVERYIHSEAMVFNEDSTYSLKKVGLVGMHISSKTVSSPQWIWATFEHVDNLETNSLDKVNGKSIKPSFYNPDCPTCPVNLFPDITKKPVKNQIQRVMPIAQSTQALNREVQTLLAAAKSPLQYYQLIGTQRPTNPSAKPYKPDTINGVVTYKLPDAITNKSGGEPTPVYLTNMIMETYFQGEGDTTSPTGYNAISLGNEPAYLQIEGFPKVEKGRIFGTESCMGCHASASIAIRDTMVKGVRTPIFGPPLAADFDWLLQLKANFKTK